ncbi:zinc-dependent alcohol dehydrogenase [Steroidobacter flavus]|uniref:Zinc-dependent alcohol dehydrogenase n=1 Tax=Steroidobacter flavus TaxID=1842136 RepID=A0ABV8T0A0_9GAMM
MKAVCWQGTGKVAVERVPDPRILNPRDAIVKVTSSAICGSDVHLYDGYVPTMMRGDILGHEFMGEVVEVGSAVSNLSIGDRVVVPFPISCGNCFFCERELFSLCENSNPNAGMAEKFWGHSPAGIFGYSHLTGGYAGGQAEYVRVPFADIGPLKVPNQLSDEQVLFLSDILPTGYMAAENCNIQPGDTVAVWGCGPVGLFAIKSALLLGAGRVIAIDRFAERLHLARQAGAEIIDYDHADTMSTLREMTGGRGPDACIDAVGMEAHMHGMHEAYDRVKQALRMETDRPGVLRQALQSCRNGGTVSVAGVYGGLVDKIPFGAIVNKALTIKSGQTHVHRYMKPLLERIEKGEIDPSFIITHRVSIDEVPDAYAMFRDKQDQCVKVVIRPS